MRIHHLDCCPLQMRLIGNPLVRSELQRTPSRCLLLEREDGELALVDTGIGLEDRRAPNRRLGAAWVTASRPSLDPATSAIGRITALGFDPAHVTRILFTHLDLDHAGGLADFPDATAHVLELERTTALARRIPPGLQQGRYRRAPLRAHRHWRTYGGASDAPGETWMGIAGSRPVDGFEGDVLLVPLPGHSRGHAGVAVRQAGGRWLLHAGDAAITIGQVGDAPYRLPPALAAFELAITVDRPGARSSLAHLRRLRAERQVRIMCAHDWREVEPVTRAFTAPGGDAAARHAGGASSAGRDAGSSGSVPSP